MKRLFYTLRVISLTCLICYTAAVLISQTAARAQTSDIEKRMDKFDSMNMEHRISVIETKTDQLAELGKEQSARGWAMLTGLGALLTEALQRVVKAKREAAEK